MTNKNQILIVSSILSLAILFYYLSSILAPFLLGILLAYLTNPLVDKLRKFGLPHTLAVITVFFMFFLFLIILILTLAPILKNQFIMLVSVIPDMLEWIQNKWITPMQEYVNITTIRTTMGGAASKLGDTFGAILASGSNIVALIINIILTPIVTFYLLKDWDLFCDTFMKMIPKSKRNTAMKLFREFDEVLSVFIRGQLIIVLALCFIYGIGLSLIGLKTGLVIGVVGGLLSFIPYLGSTFVLVFASLAALIQFTTWHALISVLVVFLIGQFIEGYVLLPNLVGMRMGLHPVVVIFAVLAGGVLFGFFGVLLALPVAAIGKVFLNFVNERYLHLGAKA